MNTITSEFLKLSKSDVVKAVIVAVLAPVAGYVGQCLQAFSVGGSFAIDPTQVWHFALTGFSAYLVKNLLTDSQGKFLGSIG